jgi:predicted nucleotidyltransferase component of viral defense system
MDLRKIRKLILAAVGSEDELVDAFVLKGGNALELIHQIGERASIDMDFSVAEDFDDPEAVADRLFHALRERFDAAGFVLFDEQFARRPSTSVPGTKWGGYTATFKLLSKERYFALRHDLEAMRRQSEASGPAQQRTFKIEISKFEYCEGKVPVDVDNYTCFVYTPEMIAAEKMRAICQQMREYELRRNPAPRARDFYDIHAVIAQTGLDVATESFCMLVQAMFEAKEVPVGLLRSVGEYREFHREDWPAVQNAVSGSLKEFDYYFDSVVGEALKLLKAHGDV